MFLQVTVKCTSSKFVAGSLCYILQWDAAGRVLRTAAASANAVGMGRLWAKGSGHCYPFPGRVYQQGGLCTRLSAVTLR